MEEWNREAKEFFDHDLAFVYDTGLLGDKLVKQIYDSSATVQYKKPSALV